MPATLEFRIEPYPDHLPGFFLGERPAAHDDNVGVVMLFGHAGGKLIPDERSPHTGKFVGYDGHADAGAAYENAIFGFSDGNGLSDALAEIGIIDGIAVVGTEITHFDTALFEIGLDMFLEIEATVIAGDKKHGGYLKPF